MLEDFALLKPRQRRAAKGCPADRQSCTESRRFQLQLAAAILILAALGAGCQSSSHRLSIKPEEALTHFEVKHSQSPPQAFSNVELALAEAYNNLARVMVLKQPETGTFLLKPMVSYQVGGAIGPIQHARYTLKIRVTDNHVALDFELGTEQRYGAYAPPDQIPGIKADFRGIAARIARSVSGTLE